MLKINFQILFIRTCFIIHFFALPCLVQASNKLPDISALGQLVIDGKTPKALEQLSSTKDEGIASKDLYLKYFALGYWSFELKKWSLSRTHLEKALSFDSTNSAHIHYLIGHSYKEEGQYKSAREHFQKALSLSPPQNIIFQARFELSELAILENSHKKAYEHLKYLEKRWRGTPNYPEIVWRLIGVELQQSKKHIACRWARIMYSRHPAHPLVASWGVQLSSNKFGVQSLGCVASSKDIRDRMSRLGLSGMAEKAQREINELRKSARPSEKQMYD